MFFNFILLLYEFYNLISHIQSQFLCKIKLIWFINGTIYLFRVFLCEIIHIIQYI
jgi:hypothetical protein